MKEIALLGPTASGKTALAIEIAQKYNANILSLDSLAIYKETDIVSAKPTHEERAGIPHYGIDLLSVDDYFSAATFFDLYRQAREESVRAGKNLIIVGGTSFYLKSLMEGLSPKVTPSAQTSHAVKAYIQHLPEAYAMIEVNDPDYAAKISPSDRYRIQKWLEIYLETGLAATHFFQQHSKEPIISDIPIFEIAVDRTKLRQKITTRTAQMIRNGLVEEIFALERKYGRSHNPMKAIGIKETLAYLDGRLSLDALQQQITIHTAQLAKRQETFNTSQFPQRVKLLKNFLAKEISKVFN